MNDFDERDLLTRELHRRSHDIGGHPIDFDTIRTGAKRVQRRRHAAQGLVAAGVLAVAVPTALTLTGGNGPETDPAQPPSLAATPTPTPTPLDEPVRLTLDGVPPGEAPKVGYLRGTALVLPDTQVDLESRFRDLAPYDGGWIGGMATGDGAGAAILDAEGAITEEIYGGSVVVSPEGDQLAYADIPDEGTGDPEVVIARTEGGEVSRLAVEGDMWAAPVGFLGPDEVVVNVSLQEAGSSQALVMGTAGGSRRVPTLLEASSVSSRTGLIAGSTSVGPEGNACGGVVDAESGSLLWEDCALKVYDLSPDGRLVLASLAEYDGLGDPSVMVLDAFTGSPVAEFGSEPDAQLAMTDYTWEDADSVLAVTNSAMSWKVLRLDLSGEVTAATEEERIDPNEGVYPFWFMAPGTHG